MTGDKDWEEGVETDDEHSLTDSKDSSEKEKTDSWDVSSDSSIDIDESDFVDRNDVFNEAGESKRMVDGLSGVGSEIGGGGSFIQRFLHFWD